MHFLFGILTTIVAIVLGAVLFVFSGLYDVSATESHTTVGRWALHQTMHNSVEARAESIEVPDLNDESMIRSGARAYDALCAACHLKPGQDSSLIRTGLNPQPPALAEGGGHGTPARQFWVIKNGIRMTGMPAWGPTHDDDELWELTAFLQKLPGLSEAEYTKMLRSPQGQNGAADDGHNHEHGDMHAMMERGDHHASSQVSAEGHHDDSGEHSSSGSHGEPGHHDTRDNSSPSAQEASSAEEDDHYADGHTH